MKIYAIIESSKGKIITLHRIAHLSPTQILQQDRKATCSIPDGGEAAHRYVHTAENVLRMLNRREVRFATG